MGDVAEQENALRCIHSVCFRGDVLGSCDDDCGERLRRAMAWIASKGEGC